MSSHPSHYRTALSLGGIQFEWITSNFSGSLHLRIQVLGMPLLDLVDWHVYGAVRKGWDWEPGKLTHYYYLPVACEVIGYNSGPWMGRVQFKHVDRKAEEAERVLALLESPINHVAPGRNWPPQVGLS